MSILKVRNLCFSINDTPLIENIDLELELGSMIGLIGPNGSGKSTLLKNMYRVLKPTKGDVCIDGKDIRIFKNKEIARKIAVVSQDDIVTDFDFKVIDIVLMGRFAYKKLLDVNNKEDFENALASLEKVDMDSFFDRSYMSLSGGEKQRVMIARAICQNADILIMDEPTNHLDIKHQLNIINYIKNLKVTTFVAIHDINIAATFCDRLIVLKNGRMMYSGKTEDIITKEMMKNIFEVDVQLVKNHQTNKINILYCNIKDDN